MKTQEFTTLLENHSTSRLQFEIEKGKFILPTYHITEIKNATVNSVDCGGNPDTYNQTIVQLLINPNEKIRKPWTSQKALSIFEKVHSKSPIKSDAEIFFEYGDSTIRTSHFSIRNVEEHDGTINVQLFVKPTVCKPSLTYKGERACC
ncbi:DUF6428 family protein [Reichenbachiella sp. MALMAid0571]|uniref:DUF6428 family protein n=1 Tax=Reichenbachiella sp. MALMAid0571 TaxID=3143939 RepID=UPI0032E034B1